MSKEINADILKDAQYRKGLSIAFFNATNASIALIASEPQLRVDEEAMIKNVLRIRDLFLEEHKNYYATVIANVGANYKSEDTIAKLNATKNYEELKSVYLSLSEDERRDGDVIKVAQSLKEKYAKVQ